MESLKSMCLSKINVSVCVCALPYLGPVAYHFILQDLQVPKIIRRKNPGAHHLHHLYQVSSGFDGFPWDLMGFPRGVHGFSTQGTLVNQGTLTFSFDRIASARRAPSTWHHKIFDYIWLWVKTLPRLIAVIIPLLCFAWTWVVFAVFPENPVGRNSD